MTTDDHSYVCDLCGETFERPSELGGHKRGHQLTVGREEFQAELRRLADEFEQTPTVSMMNEQGAYSSGPATNHFDSWTAALNSIGLSPVQQDEIPAAEVKADIRAVAREFGHPPTAAEYNEHAEYNVSTAQNKFGSWNDAFRTCGYEPHVEKRISDEALPRREFVVVNYNFGWCGFKICLHLSGCLPLSLGAYRHYSRLFLPLGGNLLSEDSHGLLSGSIAPSYLRVLRLIR